MMRKTVSTVSKAAFTEGFSLTKGKVPTPIMIALTAMRATTMVWT
jgi:hypothetical protein